MHAQIQPITDSVHYLLKKSNVCKWTQAVQTHVVQGSAVYSVEYYSTLKKKREGNPVICDSVDETGGHKWNKPT